MAITVRTYKSEQELENALNALPTGTNLVVRAKGGFFTLAYNSAIDTPLLDTYPALYAMSTRRLRTGVNSAGTLEKAGAITDQVLFNANGWVDLDSPMAGGGTLADFAGAANVGMRSFQDQSGNGLVMNNTTFNQQPIAVSGGSLVTSGTRPAVDGASRKGYSSPILNGLQGAGELWGYFVLDIPNSGLKALFETGATFFNQNGGILFDVENLTLSVRERNAGVTAIDTYTITTGRHLLTIRLNESAAANNMSEVWLDGAQLTKQTQSPSNTGQFSNLIASFMFRKDGTLNWGDKLQEAILRTGPQGADKAAIEANMAAAFGITLTP